MKNKTEDLKEKISNLENKVAEALEEQQKIKDKLGAAYAAGTDTAKLSKELSENKDSIGIMIEALRAQDVLLEKIQREEHYKLAEALDAETHKNFETALKVALKALAPLEKKMSGIMPENKIPEMMEQINETIKSHLWTTLDNDASERYSTEVPPMPDKVMARDEHGMKFEIVEAFGKQTVKTL